VRGVGLAAAFHTQYARTTQTAETVTDALNIPLVQIDLTTGQEQQHADSVRTHILNAFGGRSVLVVGHSNTIDRIAGALGAVNVPAIGLQDFDNLFVVIRLKNDSARFLRGQYGQ
jgi:phosphohistidine phosphatase SixA